jgi:Flp pilus assembly protein TadG
LKAPTVVRRAFGSSCRGQSIVEFALVLPFLMVVVLGVTEVGYALLDSHIVTKLTRESSNLISRDSTLADAATAIQSMTTRPVNFNDGSPSSRMSRRPVRPITTRRFFTSATSTAVIPAPASCRPREPGRMEARRTMRRPTRTATRAFR